MIVSPSTSGSIPVGIQYNDCILHFRGGQNKKPAVNGVIHNVARLLQAGLDD